MHHICKIIVRHIKNIIFDLGGVIINLAPELTTLEFDKLSEIPFQKAFNSPLKTQLFDRFEKGQMGEVDFFEKLKKELRFHGSYQDMLKAWNAMLLGVPDSRLDLLVQAKLNYRTFLLSNTNEAHVAAFENDLYHTNGVKHLSDYFEETYYSCRIGMIKPDREIFEFVLHRNKLKASETVFIDDSPQHVKGAGECSINAYLMQPNMDIEELLEQLRLL